MTVAIQIHVFDESEAQSAGRWGDVGFSFRGMTNNQCRVAVAVLERTLKRLKKHLEDHPEEEDVALIKHGTGEILPEAEGQKTAAKEWTGEDDAELEQELAGDEE